MINLSLFILILILVIILRSKKSKLQFTSSVINNDNSIKQLTTKFTNIQKTEVPNQNNHEQTPDNKDEDPNQMPSRPLKLKPAKIPLRICLKLALKNMWKKKFRFIVVMLICGISLAFLSVTIELNGDKLRQNVYTMIENGYQYTDIKKYKPLNKEAEKKDYYNKYNYVDLPNESYYDIKNALPELTLHYYQPVSIDYVGRDIENQNFFYPGTINTLIMFDETNTYDLITGRLPEVNSKEILVTDYLISAFNYFGVLPNCETPYDYLYQYIDLNVENQYQIVGIINTNYEKWTYLNNTQVTDIDDSSKQNYSFINDFTIMNSIVIPERYYNVEKVNVSKVLRFSKSGHTTYEWDIKTSTATCDTSNIYLKQDALTIASRSYGWGQYVYGRQPSNENEIAIPRGWLLSLFGNKNISDYTFTNLWRSNIQNSQISVKLTSSDHTRTFEQTFTIVGITTADEYAWIYTDTYEKLDGIFNQEIENVITQLPSSSDETYRLFQKAYRAGYIIDVWAYRLDIDAYEVDPFIDIVAKAGLVVFVAFTMGIMWTIITIEIVDSKKEIGILRSIGLSGPKVSLIFVLQSLIVNVLAFVIAIFIARYAISWYNSGITDNLNLITLYMYTFTYRSPLFLFIFVIGMTIVSTFIPLYRIMSQKIIDVINERE